jgi:lipopolysaccharide transport system permease protein
MGGGFSWLVLLIPVLLFLQFVGLIGVSLVLSTVGVFFKDLKEIISVFSTFGLFASPILFLPQTLAAVPQLQYVFYFNPVSIYVWCYQDAFAFGRIEHPWAWILVVPLTLLIFFTGVRCYSRFRQFLPSFV